MEPTLALMGEIRFEDGTSMLVPQRVKFAEMRSTALREAYLETVHDLPTHEEVLQHASSNPEPTSDPVWARVCVLSGGALLVVVGVCLVAFHGLWLMS